MFLVSNFMISYWKEFYQRKILINRKYIKGIFIRKFQFRIGESGKEKGKEEKYLNI